MFSLYDEILPLASFLGGAVFEPLQAAFIESVLSFLRSYHKYLNEVSFYKLSKHRFKSIN